MSNAYVPASFLGNKDENEAAAALLEEDARQRFAGLGVSVSATTGVRGASSAQYTCAECNKSIQGRVLEAMSKTYHPDCFECSKCRKVGSEMGDGFAVMDGAPVCMKCVKWLERENKISAGSTTTSMPTTTATPTIPPTNTTTDTAVSGAGAGAGPSATRLAQEQAHRNIQESFLNSVVRCSRCDKAVFDGVIDGDKTFHRECFLCGKCNKPIDGAGGFVRHETVPYHKECHEQRSESKCASCHKGISGRFVTIGDDSYHKECFVCGGCKNPLTGSFIPLDGKPHCRECFDRISKMGTISAPAPAAAAAAPRVTPGIRVDPQTRQVSQVHGAVRPPAAQPAVPAPVPNYASPAASKPRPNFCGSCGTKVQAQWKFCGGCGSAF
jgi:LIM domain